MALRIDVRIDSNTGLDLFLCNVLISKVFIHKLTIFEFSIKSFQLLYPSIRLVLMSVVLNGCLVMLNLLMDEYLESIG